MSASAIKLSSTTVEAARDAARLYNRSIAGQLEHWATIGRAVEASGRFSTARIEGFLAGTVDYDALTGEEQAVALATLEDDLTSPATPETAIAFRAELLAEADYVVGTDERYPGKIVRLYRDGRIEIEVGA